MRRGALSRDLTAKSRGRGALSDHRAAGRALTPSPSLACVLTPTRARNAVRQLAAALHAVGEVDHLHLRASLMGGPSAGSAEGDSKYILFIRDVRTQSAAPSTSLAQ